jgi:hypothetical protein
MKCTFTAASRQRIAIGRTSKSITVCGRTRGDDFRIRISTTGSVLLDVIRRNHSSLSSSLDCPGSPAFFDQLEVLDDVTFCEADLLALLRVVVVKGTEHRLQHAFENQNTFRLIFPSHSRNARKLNWMPMLNVNERIAAVRLLEYLASVLSVHK